MELKLSDFYYDLPKELIAQDPLEDRSSSRLMHIDRKTGAYEHKKFTDVIDYLNPGDCLVLNNTKVIPARLFGVREKTENNETVLTTGKVEVLLLKRRENDIWETLVKPGKKCKPGTKLNCVSFFIVCFLVRSLACYSSVSCASVSVSSSSASYSASSFSPASTSSSACFSLSAFCFSSFS